MSDRRVAEVLARLRGGALAGLGGRRVVDVRQTWLDVRRFSLLAGAHLRLDDAVLEVIVKLPRLPAGATPEKARKACERLRQEHDVPAMLRRRAAADAGGIGVVRPLAFFEDLPALVMERSAGESLLRLVERRARWRQPADALEKLAARCEAAGAWLRRFQRLTARPGERFDVDAIWAFVNDRLARLAQLGVAGVGPGFQEALRRYVEVTAARVRDEEGTVCGVHGDFSLSNVLSTEAETIVLDFSMFQTGSPVRDASRFYHQLGLLGRKPAFRPATIARLQAAFLAGWGERWSDESPLFRLFLLQHGVSHWLGLVKADGRRSLPVRLLDGWAARGDRRDLERLISEGP